MTVLNATSTRPSMESHSKQARTADLFSASVIISRFPTAAGRSRPFHGVVYPDEGAAEYTP
jgi:hypothetical protein